MIKKILIFTVLKIIEICTVWGLFYLSWYIQKRNFVFRVRPFGEEFLSVDGIVSAFCMLILITAALALTIIIIYGNIKFTERIYEYLKSNKNKFKF